MPAVAFKVHGRTHRPPQTSIIGEGGEAVVYDLSSLFGEPVAGKWWKPPTHPDYQGSDDEAKRNRALAAERLSVYGDKLRAFPAGLPDRVIGPRELLTDVKGNDVVGFAMTKLSDVYRVANLADRDTRESLGIQLEAVIRIFIDLYDTVCEVHKNGVVIGDFNYSNVLASLALLRAYLIDADTMQFGPYMCKAFTPRFVDPLVCDPKESKLVQYRPHSPDTDWYAYACQLFECLMFTSVYGGTHLPKDRRQMVPHDNRPHKRISVFHPAVVYPRNAVPLTWLPRSAAGFFEDMVAPGKDARGQPPRQLLEVLLAAALGKSTDAPLLAAPAARKEVIRGKARIRRVFDTPGAIVDASIARGQLDVLVNHDGQFEREDRSVVIRGNEMPGLSLRLSGRRTVVASQGRIAVLTPGTPPQVYAADRFQGRHIVYDTAGETLVWCYQGKLWREGRDGPQFIGSVLEGQTLIWTGSSFGFGFYRMEGYQVGFVFSPERMGINDTVKLPPLRGELVDAWCSFTEERCWFFTATRFSGEVTHDCVVIDAAGKVTAGAKAKEGDGSWLGTLRGKCAATLSHHTHTLFAAKEDGLVAVAEQGNALGEQAAFADTAEFVTPSDTLLFDRAKGLYVVNRRGIHLLTITP